MGRIVSNFFISMDGVVERPDQWHFPYFDDEMGEVVGAGMANTKAILMGRRLYDEWSQYWPAQGDEDFGAVINATPKYVLSHDAVRRRLEQHHRDLRRRRRVRRRAGAGAQGATTDGDITMSGSATTVRWLIAQGLLDELALLVHPIAVAEGQRLFEGTGKVPLQLTESRTLKSGVLLVRYAPVHRPDRERARVRAPIGSGPWTSRSDAPSADAARTRSTTSRSCRRAARGTPRRSRSPGRSTPTASSCRSWRRRWTR